MIKYKDILEAEQSLELTDKEMIAMKELERLTDEAILNQFKKHNYVHISDDIIHRLISPFGYHRKFVLQNKWVKLYDDNGWIVRYSSDSNYNVWKIYGK